MVDWTKLQIEQYITFLTDKGIKKSSYQTTDENNNYTNMSHICLDLVLSINRNYYNFVVPRVKLFQDNYPDIKNLDTLIILIEKVGLKNFHKVWNYNHIARIELLYQVCNTLKKICTNNSSYDGENEIEILRQWAENLDFNNNELNQIKGIGLSSIQYLRILLGIDTVKPDIHIKKSINNVYGTKINDISTIYFIENVSKEMGINTRKIDQFVWELYADKSREGIVWKDGKWER